MPALTYPTILARRTAACSANNISKDGYTNLIQTIPTLPLVTLHNPRPHVWATSLYSRISVLPFSSPPSLSASSPSTPSPFALPLPFPSSSSPLSLPSSSSPLILPLLLLFLLLLLILTSFFPFLFSSSHPLYPPPFYPLLIFSHSVFPPLLLHPFPTFSISSKVAGSVTVAGASSMIF